MFLLVMLSINLALLAILSVYVIRSKRWLWVEIQKNYELSAKLQEKIIVGRKEIVLSSVGDDLKLPPLMPSQNGEDVLLYNFFEGRRNGFFVDIGAFDGVGFSNSYFLEALGWEGILVEPVPEFAAGCRVSRPNSRVVEAACGKKEGRIHFNVARGGSGVGTLSYMGNDTEHSARIQREGGRIEQISVRLITLAQIVGDDARQIDVLSIDVEGAELDVLQGADLIRLRPSVIVVEDNSCGKNLSTEEFLLSVGYRKDLVWLHNVFYLLRDDNRSFNSL